MKFKQDAINEGNPFKILSQMGFNYSFNNEEEIAKTHELVKSNVGISADRMLVIPQANLEAYKEEFETADNQANALAIIGKYKAQFGKYTQSFLNDVKFTDGYSSPIIPFLKPFSQLISILIFSTFGISSI